MKGIFDNTAALDGFAKVEDCISKMRLIGREVSALGNVNIALLFIVIESIMKKTRCFSPQIIVVLVIELRRRLVKRPLQ